MSELLSETEGAQAGAAQTQIAGWIAVGTALGALITAFLGIAGDLFPNRFPSAQESATITEVAIEHAVTLDKYLAHPAVAAALPRIAPANEEKGVPDPRNDARLQHVGTVAHINFEFEGLNDQELDIIWSLHDYDSNMRLLTSSDELGDGRLVDPFPTGQSELKKDKDTESWEVWIDTEDLDEGRFFVRVELLMVDERGLSRLTFKDSPAFCLPHAPDCVTSTVEDSDSS